MKRNRFTTLLTFILVTSLAFCLVACSGGNTTPEAPTSESSTSSTSQGTSPVQTDSASSTGTSSTDVSTTAASTDAVTTSTAQLPSNGTGLYTGATVAYDRLFTSCCNFIYVKDITDTEVVLDFFYIGGDFLRLQDDLFTIAVTPITATINPKLSNDSIIYATFDDTEIDVYASTADRLTASGSLCIDKGSATCDFDLDYYEWDEGTPIRQTTSYSWALQSVTAEDFEAYYQRAVDDYNTSYEAYRADTIVEDVDYSVYPSDPDNHPGLAYFQNGPEAWGIQYEMDPWRLQYLYNYKSDDVYFTVFGDGEKKYFAYWDKPLYGPVVGRYYNVYGFYVPNNNNYIDVTGIYDDGYYAPTPTPAPTPTQAPAQVGSAGLELSLANFGNSYTVVGLGTCTDLEVVIPTSYKGIPITGIADRAFAGGAFESLTIPSSITWIGKNVLQDCLLLKTLNFNANCDLLESWAGSIPQTKIKTLYVNGSVAPKNLCPSLNPKKVVLANSVTQINEDAFHSSYIEEIVMSPNVRKIEKKAFLNSHIETITIPEGVVAIPEYCFSGCNKLKTVKLPASIRMIGNSAFQYCDSLTTIEFASTDIVCSRNSFDYSGKSSFDKNTKAQLKKIAAYSELEYDDLF